MTCALCENLMEVVPVKSASDLRRAITRAADCLTAGIIREVSGPRGLIAATSLSSLTSRSNWPDYIQSHFECTGCCERFVLSVETYHGAGGTWAPARNAEHSLPSNQRLERP
jgi:hypothetical protein